MAYESGRVSGYSRQQFIRLGKRGAERELLLKSYRGYRTSFAGIYIGADVLLLAHTGSLHGTLSGSPTNKLMERARACLTRRATRAWL